MAESTKRPTTILQFGEGNFLRAFADQMIDSANKSGVMDDGIAVVIPIDAPSMVGDILTDQGNQYHVILEGVKDGAPAREVQLVDAITEVVPAHGDFARYRELYLKPELKAVISNTTEAGITFVPGDSLTAQPPKSFPAKIAALLHDRWQHFKGAPDKGLTFLPVELIEDNGSTLKEYVLRHARENHLEPEFIEWVDNANSFHNTLVDRIVPGYPRDEIDAITAEIGKVDNAVVKGEYYGSWAIDGASGSGGNNNNGGAQTSRPDVREVLPLDRAGQPVEFMADIRPYRAKKVYILNGMHTAMAAVGLLSGAETVGKAVAKPEIERYLKTMLEKEILPSIAANPALMADDTPASLAAFAAKIYERFSNPYLRHALGDIALNSISKWQTRNLPVVVAQWERGESADAEVLAFAALCLAYAATGPQPPRPLADIAAKVPASFAVRDDADLVALVRDTFNNTSNGGGVAVDGAVMAPWVAGIIAAAGYFDGATNAQAERLASEAAKAAELILGVGIANALADVTA